MAYRGKSKRKSSGRKTYARKTTYKRKSSPKRRKAAKRTTQRTQKIVLVVQQAPATPTLATPATRAVPARARFGG